MFSTHVAAADCSELSIEDSNMFEEPATESLIPPSSSSLLEKFGFLELEDGTESTKEDAILRCRRSDRYL